MTKFYQTWSIRGVAAALFSSRRPKKFENEKFPRLKIAEIDMGVNFGSGRHLKVLPAI